MSNVKMYTLGCDISHHNEFIPNADFVIHKATEGASYVDEKFKERMYLYENTDTIRGAYHYARADKNNWKQEAEHYIKNVNKYTDILHALDVEAESLNVTNIDDWCKNWLMYVRETLRRTPFLYLSESAINKFPQCIKLFPVWVAKYSLSAKPKCQYLIWQYTSNPFDMDIYNGSKTELKTWTTEQRF